MDAQTRLDRDIPLNLYKNTDPLEVTVLENRRLTPDHSPHDVRHLVLQYPAGSFRYLEGQAVGIPPPGLNSRGRPNVPRLYSVASHRDGEDGTGTTVALTVKRLVFRDEEGDERRGLSSNHLCDARPGDTLRMTGPAGKDLLLPEDPAQHLVLVATGTGIAPFRAFLQRRRALHQAGATSQGRVWLFFGAQTRQDILYHDEWLHLADHDPGFRVTYALSREEQTADGRRMYVQDRLRAAGAELWALLARPDTSFFVCGIKGMELGIEDALIDVAAAHGADWGAVRAQMTAEERWKIEVY